MSREYRSIQEYEKEIKALYEKGLTHREIGKRFGLSKEQIKEYLKRERRKEQKRAAGIVPKKKGRPRKNSAIVEQDKATNLEYVLSCKEKRIKELEMENELLRDFLSLAERK